jgi:hypothetical protein
LTLSICKTASPQRESIDVPDNQQRQMFDGSKMAGLPGLFN